MANADPNAALLVEQITAISQPVTAGQQPASIVDDLVTPRPSVNTLSWSHSPPIAATSPSSQHGSQPTAIIPAWLAARDELREAEAQAIWCW
ncbi:hypothetical protein IAT38_001158 [Cryptococcus sp. DSM 104549]